MSDAALNDIAAVSTPTAGSLTAKEIRGIVASNHTG